MLSGQKAREQKSFSHLCPGSSESKTQQDVGVPPPLRVPRAPVVPTHCLHPPNGVRITCGRSVSTLDGDSMRASCGPSACVTGVQLSTQNILMLKITLKDEGMGAQMVPWPVCHHPLQGRCPDVSDAGFSHLDEIEDLTPFHMLSCRPPTPGRRAGWVTTLLETPAGICLSPWPS